MKTEMMFKKFGRSKFVQMRLKKVTKEINDEFARCVHERLPTYINLLA